MRGKHISQQHNRLDGQQPLPFPFLPLSQVSDVCPSSVPHPSPCHQRTFSYCLCTPWIALGLLLPKITLQYESSIKNGHFQGKIVRRHRMKTVWAPLKIVIEIISDGARAFFFLSPPCPQVLENAVNNINTNLAQLLWTVLNNITDMFLLYPLFSSPFPSSPVSPSLPHWNLPLPPPPPLPTPPVHHHHCHHHQCHQRQ